MHDPTRSGPEGDVRDSPIDREEHQISGLIGRTVVGERDLPPLPDLLRGVAEQRCAARGPDGLREPGAIDPPVTPAAPQVRRATVPAQCKLRGGDEPRLCAELDVAAHFTAHRITDL